MMMIQSFYKLILLSAALSNVAIVASATTSATPPVQVSLKTPWSKPPLILEILESIDSENKDSFFPLVTHLTSKWALDPSSSSHSNPINDSFSTSHHPISLSEATDLQLYSAAEKIIRFYDLLNSTSDSIDEWKLNLALHSTSPKIAAFYQLYQSNFDILGKRWQAKVGQDRHECGSWVDWNGKVLCGEDELRVELAKGANGNSPSPPLLPFDHILSSQPLPADSLGSSKASTAVLYGDPFSSNFWSLHSVLLEHVIGSRSQLSKTDKDAFQYVLRWKPSETSNPNSNLEESSGFLSGYGAALDLKKVDYLVIDDRKLKASSSVEDRIQDPEGLQNFEDDQEEKDRIWFESEMNSGGKKSKKGNDDPKEDWLSSLTNAELAKLGYQAIQAITTSSNPLKALKELSQNFPSHAVNLARHSKKATESVVKETNENHKTRFRAGSSDIWFNGKALDKDSVNPLGLLKTLKAERPLVSSLLSSRLNFTHEQVFNLITIPSIGQAQSEESGAAPIFDASDRIEKSVTSTYHDTKGTGAITWWNDLEKDEVYQGRFPKELNSLLQSPPWPGSFPVIARNLFQVVAVLDLSNKESCRFISESVAASVSRIGLRWGIVPGGLEESRNELALQTARLFWYIFDTLGPEGATQYLRRLSIAKTPSDKVDLKNAKSEFTTILRNNVPPEGLEAKFEELISVEAGESDDRVRSSKSYISRLRATVKESPRGHVFVNGQHLLFGEQQLFQKINKIVSSQLQSLLPQIYYQELTDEDDLENIFYDHSIALSSRSELLFPPTDSSSSVRHPMPINLPIVIDSLEHDEFTRNFLYPQGSDEISKINATVWLLGDLDSARGKALLLEGLKALVSSFPSQNAFRLGFVHLPSTTTSSTSTISSNTQLLSTFLYQLISSSQLQNISPDQLKEVILSYEPPVDNLDTDGKISGRSHEAQVVLEKGKGFASYASEAGWNLPGAVGSDKFWRSAKTFANSLGMEDDEFAVVVNGKAVVGLNPSTTSAEDIKSLISFEHSRRIEPVVDGLAEIGIDLSSLSREQYTEVVTLTCSVLSVVYGTDSSQEGMFTNPSKMRMDISDQVPITHTGFEIGDKSTALFRFVVVLDPLSEVAQKWSSVLELISKLPNTYIRVSLNPQDQITELPLKRFYRFSAPSELSFDKNGKEIQPSLSFKSMPKEAVLTLGLDAPPAWLTMASEAIYDLDNIRLKDVPSSASVKAVYELKRVLIEGHAREGKAGIPRGLQLVLDTSDKSTQLDTIVMANLAYFQFRALPGVYNLQIREGRSSEVFEMTSAGGRGWNSPLIDPNSSEAQNLVALTSLDGVTIYPRFKKRKGMEKEQLLEELPEEGKAGATSSSNQVDSSSTGALGKAKSLFNSLRNTADASIQAVKSSSKSSNNATINIFTVASGHLYERMTYIMILSVLKHTDSSVKFWFIENFLSPSFKEFIPHFAAEYGFEYELVAYAWPHWLRSQKEKQRTIWGTKILFLDVLFPLDLQKVIFVDADQIVRTDMKELMDVDLKGAPYGYPPMGDDSYDMDGFRFWKQGYWKTFLRDRPYHISALYVVDLARFRRVAAGDRLRGQYQSLSADPGSLANLDQDLPNNLQFTLPIFTLDKTWLWCETWCSTDWLPQAKTIDLCSNPKTKEPKLDRARRQIPEWTVYDDEIAAFAAKISNEGKIGANVVSKEEVEKVPIVKSSDKGKVEEGTSSHQHDEL